MLARKINYVEVLDMARRVGGRREVKIYLITCSDKICRWSEGIAKKKTTKKIRTRRRGGDGKKEQVDLLIFSVLYFIILGAFNHTAFAFQCYKLKKEATGE